MATNLDKALDDIIKDKKGGKRRDGDFTRGRQGVSAGFNRNRAGGPAPSSRINRSFVRSVNLHGFGRNSGGTASRQNINGQWTHDLFNDDLDVEHRDITSRLGSRSRIHDRSNGNAELLIENLHYNVTEKDLQDLFEMVGAVEKVRIVFDRSGRSTGVANVRFTRQADAEKAITKYNNVELDGQPMRIAKAPEKRNDRPARRSGFKSHSTGPYDRSGRRGGFERDRTSRKNKSATDLDEEMDAYMKTPNASSTNNDDSTMMLD